MGELAISVVVPVYNEGPTIAATLAAWDDALARLGEPAEIRVYDDGSTDETPAILDAIARERPRIVVVHQANCGHGPTILRGYREARGRFVVQIDGDDEVPVSAFGELWTRRTSADLVLGYRVGRPQSAVRHLVSRVARLVVRVLFGIAVRDPNIPFRLHHQEALATLLPAVPADAFAPNVILVGLAGRRGLRVVECPVPFQGRVQGGSFVGWRVWRGAVVALLATVRAARQAR